MKLALVATEFPPGPGGIASQAHDLVSELGRRGWACTVLSPQSYVTEAQIAAFNRARPFKVVRLPARSRLPLQIAARLRVAQQAVGLMRPDVLISSGDGAIYPTALLARAYGVPWLAIEHGRLPTSRWERLLKRTCYERARAVVCVSRYTESRLAEQARVRRSVVIPNGADASLFQVLPAGDVARFRERLGLARARIVLTVGLLSERKGQEVVIRALPRLRARVPGVVYVMVGEPALRERFAALARELGVEDGVLFAGRVARAELPLYYNACDVFTMTSRHTEDEFEGFGIAVVEAALCGKPAVVTRESGLLEAISDGVTGLAVPCDDPAATAEALASILTQASLGERMGAAALARALHEQTWERRSADYDTLLRELVSGSTSLTPPHRGT